MCEEWRPIPGVPRYEASNEGRIRHVGLTASLVIGGWQGRRREYRVFTYRVCKAFKRMSVHKAVALAWIGPRPSPDHTLHHKDHNTVNNRPDNLEWLTSAEHRERHQWGNANAR